MVETNMFVVLHYIYTLTLTPTRLFLYTLLLFFTFDVFSVSVFQLLDDI